MPMTVGDMLRLHRPLHEQEWKRYRIKDGEKGPMVWEIKHVLIYPRDEQGLPAQAYHLIVARNVLDPTVLKYFASNAPPNASVPTMLLVAFSRWRVERCFEDEKSELGLDHYEGRLYQGLKRHLIISAVSHLFLAKVHEDIRGGKPKPDGVPSPHSDGGGRQEFVAFGTSWCTVA